MKRFLLMTALSAAALGSAPVGAQPRANAGQKGGRAVPGRRDAAKELGLSPAQIAKIKAIQSAGYRQIMALKGNKSLPAAQKQARFKALLAGNMTKINAILTPAQRQKLARMMAARRPFRSR